MTTAAIVAGSFLAGFVVNTLVTDWISRESEKVLSDARKLHDEVVSMMAKARQGEQHGK